MSDYNATYAELYDDYAPITDDLPFFLEEAQARGGPVLDLACGTGRVAIPLAEAGHTVCGLELSEDMLAIAHRKIAQLAPETQARIHLRQGDMRAFQWERLFPLIIIPARSFLHIETPEDQRRVLTCIHSHLAPQGRLILTLFDPDLQLLWERSQMRPVHMEKVKEFTHTATGVRYIVWMTRQYDLNNQTIQFDQFFDALDNQNRVIHRTYYPLRLRYTFRQELQYLFELCGFEVDAVYANFERKPMHYSAGSVVWIAKKQE